MQWFNSAVLLLLLAVTTPVVSIEDYELDLYDLVEEVNGTFYDFMDVAKDCSTSDIRKAYRKFAVILHPDKNSAEDAETQFRQLAGIYEVLKSSEKRARYDEILVNGLPTWRQPLYYYRKVRKFGFAESSVVLALIVTVIHYAMLWAAYWEKSYEIEEVIQGRKKKTSKRKNHQNYNDELDDIMESALSALEKPTVWKMVPFLLIKAIVRLLCSFPSCIMAGIMLLKERINPPPVKEDEEEDETLHKRKPVLNTVFSDMPAPEMATQSAPVTYTPTVNKSDTSDSEQEIKTQTKAKASWTDEDYSNLAKAMVKFPTGTNLRWEKIAQHIGHRPAEVVSRAKQMKSSNFTSAPPTSQQTVIKKKGNTISVPKGGISVQYENPQESAQISANIEEKKSPTEWSQEQQKSLEKALASVPKTADRWTLIADLVPGKSKVECMTRYKHLVELVKQKKEKTS